MKSIKFMASSVLIFFVAVFLIACSGGGGGGGQVSSSYPVTLLQTTDMHSHASGVGPFLAYTPMNTADNDTVLGGFARLAAKIKEIRTTKTSSGSAVILVDSGDYTMGTVYDFLWDTDPASLKFIQAMQYDLITLGNHEFEFGPAKLATIINKAITVSGFNIPIIASNTVFDGADDLETLQTNGKIITTYVKTFPNGFKIGFIGLMGKDAAKDAPSATPVTFKYDYAGTDKAYVQGIVDDLRNNQYVNVVIALSHSGVDPTTDPVSGDDITLAQNITGIDIIASGHVHIMTPEIIDIPNTATPTNITHIICAGSYTTNLAQLDFTVTANGVTGLVLTNHTIDDTIPGDSVINNMVIAMNTQINTILSPLGIAIADIKETMGNFALNGPSSPGENGLGNMLADSLRYAGTETSTFTIGAIAIGEIKNSFIPLQSITFADLFAAVPLGITTATDQGNSYPGYPLLKVYLTGNEIWDMCKFNALIILYNLYIEDFIHLSGIQYTESAGAVSSVNAYAWNDYKCIGATTAVAKDATLYPLIVDSYIMNMLLSPSIQSLLTALGISVHPKLSDGTTLVSTSNMLQTRLDKDPGTAGIQEYYAWSALLNYFTSPIASGGLSGAPIPADPYNLLTTTHKRINP
jgi:5''-nucleotidase/2'',3''-cyclic phosphodiesterase and related esterases